jgi:hypothetical protein
MGNALESCWTILIFTEEPLRMTAAAIILGTYRDPARHAETLALRFSSAMLAPQRQWLNNSVIAHFVAEYWRTLATAYQSCAIDQIGDVAESVSYIANELLDNAMKYGSLKTAHATQIALRLSIFSQNIDLYVTNASVPQQWRSFQDYLATFLTEEPEQYYFRQMEANAASRELTVSRLGLLSILCDYHGQLGWKFEAPSPQCPDYLVTTMVHMPIVHVRTSCQ